MTGGRRRPSQPVACDGPDSAGRRRESGMRLAVIPGDGIGPEVIDEALKVLEEVVPGTETTNYDVGAARWHSTGELRPEAVPPELQQHDAPLPGAGVHPSAPTR